MSFTNQALGALGTVAGAVTMSKHLKNQENQTEAIKENTSKIDMAQEKWDKLPGAGLNLQNAQASRKAMESLLNSQYPYRNLKGWKPEDQLGKNQLDQYNRLMQSYNTAKEAEIQAGLEFNQGLTTTLTEEVKDNDKE